jgi:hypothetical protein
MRREIENWKNLVRFPHKMRGAFCYKRSREDRREREEEPGRKVVRISSQPGCRNSGKNEGKILFQNETRELKSHEKMSGKIILSRIRANANEIVWKCRNERNAILSGFLAKT